MLLEFNESKISRFLNNFSLQRSYKPWANHITPDASVAVFAMSAWTEFHLRLMWITRFTA